MVYCNLSEALRNAKFASLWDDEFLEIERASPEGAIKVILFAAFALLSFPVDWRFIKKIYPNLIKRISLKVTQRKEKSDDAGRSEKSASRKIEKTIKI